MASLGELLTSTLTLGGTGGIGAAVDRRLARGYAVAVWLRAVYHPMQQTTAQAEPAVRAGLSGEK